MRNELLTIITPIYNRAELLKVLFESLKKQKNKNFIWLIVDDGSTEDILEVVEQFYETSDFNIEFHKKKNGGKHTALNLAFSKLETELMLIVDSDDTLIPEATDMIERNWKGRLEQDVAGCVFLKGYKRDECVGNSEIEDGTYDMTKALFQYRIDGDKAEVFRCDIIKKYRFPEYDGERFLGEDYIWRQIYLKYRMMYCNQIIYLCEYMEGGLTLQGRKLRLLCPLGGMAHSKVSMHSKFPMKERMKRAWLYICYGKFAGMKYREIAKSSGYRILITTNYIWGMLLYFYWKKKYL